MKFKFVERVIYLFMCAVIALMGFVLTADAQQFLVRTIYFQPANAPGVKGNLSRLLERTQDFFRSEMERYGYGQKTFRYERDGNGDIEIHVIKGKHRLNHYLQDTYRRIAQELPFKFTLDPRAKDNVHIIVLGGTRQLDNGSAGYAWSYPGKGGGNALVAGNALEFRLVAHEIGHTFGLKHTGIPGALMGAWDDMLLDYETHWLDRHHLFNDRHIRNNLPKFVESLPIEALPERMVRFKIVASSKSGLHQAQIYRDRQVFLVGESAAEGKQTTIEIDARRGDVTKTDQMNVQIMDIHGNYILKRLGRVILPDPIPNVVEETVECPECDAPVDEKDLAVDPQWKLTTQWAVLKQR